MAAGVAGCAGSGTGQVGYSASATVSTPAMVYVHDDVQVIENYHEPVFYSGNAYWRFDNGVWYSSQYHTRGWIRVERPPAPILRIERPTAYIRYRANANVNVRDHRDQPHVQPDVRDHRDTRVMSDEQIRDQRKAEEQRQREDRDRQRVMSDEQIRDQRKAEEQRQREARERQEHKQEVREHREGKAEEREMKQDAKEAQLRAKQAELDAKAREKDNQRAADERTKAARKEAERQERERNKNK